MPVLKIRVPYQVSVALVSLSGPFNASHLDSSSQLQPWCMQRCFRSVRFFYDFINSCSLQDRPLSCSISSTRRCPYMCVKLHLSDNDSCQSPCGKFGNECAKGVAPINVWVSRYTGHNFTSFQEFLHTLSIEN